MSNHSEPIQILNSQTLDYTMSSSLSAQLRRARPSQVQTNFQSQPATMPASAISASSVASSSRQSSPIMSPETAVLTTNSSVQVSPEAMRPKDDDQCPTNFQLPESILARKTSANSLGHSWMNTTSPIAEAASNLSTTAPSTITPNTTNNNSNNKGNLIRRLSSRASRRITSRRRQSSAAPTSRDGSVGPCFLRRRSDSNNTAPPEFASVNTDSESDIDDKDEFTGFRAIFYLDGALRDSSANSITGSVNGSSNTMDGPVIPLQLQQGTWIKKVTKNRLKRVRLVYEPDANKLIWDKARPHKFLHVDEVREVRFGSDVHQYTRDYKMGESERTKWFSILYSIPEKSKSKLIHLIADDMETRDMWISFLDAMLKHRQNVMTSLMSFNDKAIAQFWQSEMSKQYGDQARAEQQAEMDILGVMRVCQNLHIYSSQSTLQANFHISDSRRRERLNFNEFLEFLRRMRQRRDVQRIIRGIAARPELGITVDEFLTFLRDVQGEDVDSNRSLWERYFAGYVRKHKSDDAETIETGTNDISYMSENAFVGFLASSHNMPLTEEPQEYILDRPMNEYFISSSHNTYLLGRQVAGQSSIEGYINALVRGCRCVEVDCWDGSDGQPQVVHGRTLTTAISFREVMKTINKYAFVKSRFPLWISLEVHCNPAQQAIMTEIIKESFGSRLVTEQLDPESTKLPSPSELMERILIKVKKPQSREEAATTEIAGRRRGNSLNSPLMRPILPENTVLTPSQSVPQSPLLSASISSRRLVGKNRVNTINEGEVQELMGSSSTSDTESGSDIVPMRKSSNKTVKILGDLGVYCAGVKFPGFDAPDAKKFNHIFSFMESSFAKHSRTKDEKMALDIHNMRYLMRVYPDGMRLGSSNFDPLIYWRRGVQMNALNWQTFDLGMQLNHAMFEGGKDASGYVLKPTELRDIRVLPYNVDIAEGKKERSVVSFSIDVVSAQQLMRPASLAASKSMDPYIEIEVFHANDKRDKKEIHSNLTHEPDSPLKVQTEVIRENGFNPLFTNGQFKFKVTTKHPELIFVRWSVRLSTDGESYNRQDRPAIATYTAKLTNLKQGYRTLPLLNHAGDQYLFSTLFCKIKVENIEKTLIDAPRQVSDRSKLNRLGGKVFGRVNTSPRGTIEKSSMEKASFESN